MENCRVCNHEVRELDVVSQCRFESFSLKKEPFRAVSKDIELFSCPNCSHVQSENLLSEDFYDSYTEWEGFSQYSGSLDLCGKKIEKLRAYCEQKGKLFEIGSGTGQALKLAEPYFSSCIGIEPSKRTSLISKENGGQVINACFDRNLNLPEDFSAFMSFQVFEHLMDLKMVINYAYQVLQPGGVGLINVPNGLKIMQQSLYHQVICEHVNYFTPFSIGLLAKEAGFDILELENIDSTCEMDLYIKKPMTHISLEDTVKNQRKRLEKLIFGSEAITIWGAGAKSARYSQLLTDDIPIRYLVDSSAEKVGLYVSGINVPVQLVSKKVIECSDLIIIFASAYNREIIKQIREDYQSKCRIVYMDGSSILEI